MSTHKLSTALFTLVWYCVLSVLTLMAAGGASAKTISALPGSNVLIGHADTSGPSSDVVLPFVGAEAPRISVRVDGLELFLVVDTGSPTSFLTETACRKLNKRTQKQTDNKTFAAQQLELGEWRISAPIFRVMPDEKAIAYNDESDGLLGMDVLHRVAIRWDFTRSLIRSSPKCWCNFSHRLCAC